MNVMTRIADKAGALGSIVSAMGCGACFPALASLGAALGLGFLSQFEALFVTVLLPLFAGLALLANALGWFSHRQWHRSVLGMIGPAIVLVASFTVAEKLLYVGDDGRRVGVGLRLPCKPALRARRLRGRAQALLKAPRQHL